jgi:hypothetical protein
VSDPLYGSVVALLNFVDNEVIDRSPIAGSFTVQNGAALVAGSPTVMRLDGVNDYVAGPSGSQYAFPGEFCIEFVAKKSAAAAANYDTALTTDTSNASGISGWIIELGSVRGFTIAANSGALLLSAATTINDGAVHHWCVRRGADGVVRLDKDGTQLASVTYSGTVPGAGMLGVGRNNTLSAYPFAGDVLGVRITKAQRYSGTSYTPDTAPFEYGFSYLLSGTVTGSTGTPVARVIRAHREDTGAYVGGAISNDTTGAYSITTGYAGEHTLVAYPVTGENLPALVHRGVIPI